MPLARDLKLWPGGGREWDWSETGTRHVPGIQLADAREILDHGATTLVLSRGMQLVLQTPLPTLEALAAAGVAVHVLETRAAAALYNELAAQGIAVGALIHSTC
ncbi:MAG: hypothetical protein JSR73_18860 [Proteobacteria bacterium]|nr:hypothetical protein [Pseudomonadota bacterium]